VAFEIYNAHHAIGGPPFGRKMRDFGLRWPDVDTPEKQAAVAAKAVADALAQGQVLIGLDLEGDDWNVGQTWQYFDRNLGRILSLLKAFKKPLDACDWKVKLAGYNWPGRPHHQMFRMFDAVQRTKDPRLASAYFQWAEVSARVVQAVRPHVSALCPCLYALNLDATPNVIRIPGESAEWYLARKEAAFTARYVEEWTQTATMTLGLIQALPSAAGWPIYPYVWQRLNGVDVPIALWKAQWDWLQAHCPRGAVAWFGGTGEKWDPGSLCNQELLRRAEAAHG